jgi:hypothetical protein
VTRVDINQSGHVWSIFQQIDESQEFHRVNGDRFGAESSNAFSSEEKFLGRVHRPPWQRVWGDRSVAADWSAVISVH